MTDLIAALQEELEQTKMQRDEALAAAEELDALRQRHEYRAAATRDRECPCRNG